MGKKLEVEVQIISGAIDKLFVAGVDGVAQAAQIVHALGALQNEHYSDELKTGKPPEGDKKPQMKAIKKDK